MKNVEKLVPVAVAGLVLASAGTVDARAEDTAPAVDTNPATSEEEKVESSASSSEIKSATTVTETSGTTEDGTKTTDSIINVDTDGNTVTDEGQVTTQTEVTDSTTSEPVPTGPSTSTTVTNPDGSTTTTTTQPNETTTTETSETEIKGEITPPEDNTPPTDEEKKELEGEVTGAIGDKNLSDINKGDTFGADENGNNGFKVTDKASEEVELKDDQGNKTGTETTTTVTFEKVVEKTESGEDYGLTDAELGVILGAELTKNEDGTYTYTKDGATVTVTVEANTGSETTTTTYSIKVSQTTKKIDDKKETGSKDDISDIIYGKDDTTSASADKTIDDLLAQVEKGNAQQVSSETVDGTTTTVYQGTGDNKNFTYTVKETITDLNLTEKPSNDIILAWLGEGFKENAEGKIVKVEGTSEYEVNFTATPEGKIVVRTMTVTNAHGEAGKVETDKPSPDDIDSDMRLSPAEEAAMQAVYLAIDADGINDHIAGVPEITFNEVTGIYTVKVTVDGGKVYTYTVTASTSENTQKWDAERVKVEDVHSGSTTTITGSAYVSGETVVWTQTTTPGGLTVTGDTVTAGQDFFDKLYGEGKTVKSVTLNDDGNTVVVVEDADGKTHTYTYTFQAPEAVGSWDSLSEDEKAELLAGLGDNVAITDFTSLKKISWTVKEVVDNTQTSDTTVEIIKDVTPSADGSYTFNDGNKTITFESGTTTKTETVKGEDGVTTTTTYTLEIVDGQVPMISAEDLKDTEKVETYRQKIADILGSKYSNVVVGEDGKITATYTDADKVTDNVTVTITPDSYKVYTVKKTVTTSEDKNLAVTDNNQSEAWNNLLTQIKAEVQDAKEHDKQAYVTVDGTEYALDVVNGELVGLAKGAVKENITQGELIQWIQKNTAVNFDALGDQALIDYLNNAKANSSSPNYQLDHLDLLVSGTVKADGKDEDCVVKKDDNFKVTVYESAEDLVNHTNGKTVELKDSITKDPASGRNEYKREDGEDHVLGDEKYQFYSVEGTVAYGFVQSYNLESYANSKAQEIGGVVVEVDGKFHVYKSTANLKAYGYLGGENNGCAWQNYQNNWKNILKPGQKENEGGRTTSHGTWQVRGYDLLLGNLTLLPDGTVTASGENTYSYSTKLSIRSSKTDVLTGAGGHKLSVKNTVTTLGTKDEDRNELAGSKLTGEYEVTETRTDKDLGSEEGGWKYEGGAETKYNTWTN